MTYDQSKVKTKISTNTYKILLRSFGLLSFSLNVRAGSLQSAGLDLFSIGSVHLYNIYTKVEIKAHSILLRRLPFHSQRGIGMVHLLPYPNCLAKNANVQHQSVNDLDRLSCVLKDAFLLQSISVKDELMKSGVVL